MLSLSSIAQPGERKLLGLKIFYARCCWAIRSGLSGLKLYQTDSGENRRAHAPARKRQYLRSLLAIYDVKEMAKLDLAWWTYDAMEWADDFLKSRKNPTVFEFGSGASTIWLAKRATSVVSVENDKGFYTDVKTIKPSNVDYIFADADSIFDPRFESKRRDLSGQSFKEYVLSLSKTDEKFDLIVIDGRARHECMAVAQRHLKPGGAILVDNTDMQRYSDVKPMTEMKTLITKGLTPCLPYPTETTIYVSAD